MFNRVNNHYICQTLLKHPVHYSRLVPSDSYVCTSLIRLDVFVAAGSVLTSVLCAHSAAVFAFAVNYSFHYKFLHPATTSRHRGQCLRRRSQPRSPDGERVNRNNFRSSTGQRPARPSGHKLPVHAIRHGDGSVPR